MNYIYKITCLINNKIYIGKAKNISARFKQHVKASFNVVDPGYENPIHRAIRKYGPENFIVEQIDSAETLREINKKEKYWIDFLNARCTSIGYNLAAGGDGGDLLSNKSKEDYELAREHYKQAAIIREANPEKRKKISETMKLKRATTNPIWNKGISPSKESIEKFKATMQQKRQDGWVPRHGFAAKNRKAVLCVELNIIFADAKEACIALGLDIKKEKRIRDFCNGKIKKAQFGYHWQFVKNNIN